MDRNGKKLKKAIKTTPKALKELGTPGTEKSAASAAVLPAAEKKKVKK